MIRVGDKMPEFTAADQFGKDWSNDELIGYKTVIYAYPKDNTPGCTAEACDIRDNYERFLSLGYRVFGVSKDSRASHIKFATKFELPFPLLSDPDHSLLEALGAWGEKKTCGKVCIGTLRTTFIFDEEGTCIDVIKKVDTKTHTAQILK
ncbi:MAG: peroxiredoxin [Bacteroidia bacterium]|nr:peroxiredoxin [Bacteroidia bacterium]